MTTSHCNGHSLWTSGARPGACRFCGESNVSEAWTCPTLKPRLAAKEAKARAVAA